MVASGHVLLRKTVLTQPGKETYTWLHISTGHGGAQSKHDDEPQRQSYETS